MGSPSNVAPRELWASAPFVAGVAALSESAAISAVSAAVAALDPPALRPFTGLAPGAGPAPRPTQEC